MKTLADVIKFVNEYWIRSAYWRAILETYPRGELYKTYWIVSDDDTISTGNSDGGH